MQINIRKETSEDINNIENLIFSAFSESKLNYNNENGFVERIRKSSKYNNELALVAEYDNKVVGYILFSTMKIGKDIVLVLAPLAVLPNHQKMGIGTKLIIEGHKIANNLLYQYSIVVGDDEYYSKFGYEPSINFGINSPSEIPCKNFMIKKLNKKATVLNGIVKYSDFL